MKVVTMKAGAMELVELGGALPAGLRSVFWALWRDFTDPVSRLYFGYWLSAFAIAVFVLRGQGQSVRVSLRWLARVVVHPSFRLDAGFLVLATATAAIVGPPLTQGAVELSIEIARTSHRGLGDPAFSDWGRGTATVVFGWILFVVDDLSRYVLHRALHEVPWLWRFHRLHHSAVILTPLTFKRQHPVEVILFAARHALVLGLVSGIILYLFRGRLGLTPLAISSGVVVASQWLGANLRHSHVRWGWGDALESVVISPAQHQVHHSRDAALQCSNFGSVLSIWDGVFGTLVRSSTTRVVRFGLKNSS